MNRFLIFPGLLIAFLAYPEMSWGQSNARQAGYLYLSPVPNASYESQQTRNVLVRFTHINPSEITNLATGFITVTGAHSGLHPGTCRLASDGRTVIFTMTRDFSTNELVTVSLQPGLNASTPDSVQSFQYQFMVTAPMPGSLPLALSSPAPSLAGAPKEHQSEISTAPSQPNHSPKVTLFSNGVAVPSDFPTVQITANNNPSPGYLFLENALDGVPPYTMMLDNNGLPIWYRRGRMYDFKIQKNGVITWGVTQNTGFSGFDQNFNYLKTYLATNGYITDAHELKVQPDGTYFLIGTRNNAVDMSKYVQGGVPGTIVTETVVQQFTAADELIFQWRAWDNYDIRDLGGNSDFPHMNGLDIDEDGNLLVSARHLSEVTKVNLDSGDIMWHLSGPHNSFNFVNDPFNGTSYQHNISALGNGHYMVFDNGDTRNQPISRAVEYQINLTNATATLVWQFRDVPDKYTYWLGNAQRLPTGNTLINFVLPQYPKAVEVDTNGVKHFELSLIPGSDAYRAFRFPWNGVEPAPYLVAEPQVDNITLIYNKFGDTNVASYRIYGGISPHPTTLLTVSPNRIVQLSHLPSGINYFRVTSVSETGVESPYSNEETVNVNFVPPGQNIVLNGNFAQGSTNWTFATTDTGNANWLPSAAHSEFDISNGGAGLTSVHLVQTGKALAQGKRYVLDFDAWSDQIRYIQVQLAQAAYPYLDYSGITPPFLTPNRSHFRFIFTMNSPSDFSANLVFNLGGSTAEVFLANISLFSPPVGDLNLDGHVDFLDFSAFVKDWMKRQPGLSSDFNANGTVDFNDLATLGANWPSLTP
jgi:hypothetical protein